MKGPRNKLKKLILSDMVHRFQHDANIISRQSKSLFSKVGPGEIPGPCQKFFFQLKNSHRISKQLQSVSKYKKIVHEDPYHQEMSIVIKVIQQRHNLDLPTSVLGDKKSWRKSSCGEEMCSK